MNLVIEESASHQNAKEFKKRKSSTKTKQTGKYEDIFKRFLKKVGGSYKCHFCKKPFKEDAYLKQLEVHLKIFHNIPEKEFNQLFKPLFVVSEKNNYHVQHSKMKKDDVSNCKNVHNITLSPKRLKKKIAKSVISPDPLNKELKKIIISKLEKEGKKYNQTANVNRNSKKDDDEVEDTNENFNRKLHSESIVKLHCHVCHEKLEYFNEAINHQTEKHHLKKISSKEMKKMFYQVLDGSNYQNNIEVEDIRLYIIEENLLKKDIQVIQLGVYKDVLNRKSFKKYLYDVNIKTNFTIVKNLHLAKEEKENTKSKTSDFLKKIINQGFIIFNHFTDVS